MWSRGLGTMSTPRRREGNSVQRITLGNGYGQPVATSMMHPVEGSPCTNKMEFEGASRVSSDSGT